MMWYEDKEHQLMCEKAVELQNKAKKVLRVPPKTITHLHRANVCVDGHGRFWKGYLICGGAFQIFSQEDLQEMVKDLPDTILPWTLIRAFFKWTLKIYTHEFGDTSMTKLWMAFVMHELYQKKWNPEKKEWEEELRISETMIGGKDEKR